MKINRIRLATHFHAEHLLDKEHYMDWVLMSLENTSQVKLPIWLLITQIYWKDLLQSRKYGRRLSNCLLSQLAEVLQLLILIFVPFLNNPRSLVVPIVIF